MDGINELKSKMDISLQKIKDLQKLLLPIQEQIKNELEIINECRDRIIEIRNELKK